ncbi:MAG: glycosyltransferase family 39 protein, partial [Chloroflexi bacterium]|nr:glycosyltransferase family 39 protein [Chloroflexota bacterium]
MLAREISLNQLPVYLSSYAGREPLYMYLLALLFQLMGPTLLAIRFLPLIISLATLAISFWLIRDLFGKQVALLSTALWGTSLWAQTAGRYSHANLLMPPLGALAFLALWRGYQKGHLGWFLAGGLFIGLDLYTYAAARFFPLAVLVVFLGLALVDRERWQKNLPLITTGATLASLVAVPLISHFLSHPDDFWERPEQVFLFSVLPPERWAGQIVENSAQTIAGFFIEGDSNWRVNLPPLPIFDPLIGVGFISGLVLTLWRWRRPEYLLAVLWLVVMSLPAILTRGPHPNTQRLIGTWPILLVFPALGLFWLGEKALDRFSFIAPRLLPFLISLLVLAEGANTFRLYFGEWASSPQVYHWYDVAYKEMIPLLQREMQAGRELVIGSLHYRHPTLAFLLPRTSKSTWMLGGKTIVFPQSERDEIAYVIGLPDNPQKPEVTGLLSSLAYQVETYPDPAGDPAILVYHMARGSTPKPSSESWLLSFNGEVILQDIDLLGSWRRDEPLPVFISWSVLSSPPAARSLVLHLVDERGVLWSQSSEAGYIWDQWKPGDLVYQWPEFPLERSMPPGLYEVRLFLTDAAANPLPVLSREGNPQGIFLSLGKVEITPQGGLVETVSQQGVPFGQSLQVIDFDKLRGSIVPG